MMQRRRFIGQAGILTAGAFLAPSILRADSFDFPTVRIPKSERKFSSDAIENVIASRKN